MRIRPFLYTFLAICVFIAILFIYSRQPFERDYSAIELIVTAKYFPGFEQMQYCDKAKDAECSVFNHAIKNYYYLFKTDRKTTLDNTLNDIEKYCGKLINNIRGTNGTTLSIGWTKCFGPTYFLYFFNSENEDSRILNFMMTHREIFAFLLEDDIPWLSNRNMVGEWKKFVNTFDINKIDYAEHLQKREYIRFYFQDSDNIRFSDMSKYLSSKGKTKFDRWTFGCTITSIFRLAPSPTIRR